MFDTRKCFHYHEVAGRRSIIIDKRENCQTKNIERYGYYVKKKRTVLAHELIVYLDPKLEFEMHICMTLIEITDRFIRKTLYNG